VIFGKKEPSKTHCNENQQKNRENFDFVHEIVHTQKENSPEKGYILAPFARVAPTP
jgi:hypothetical protein